MEIKDFKEMIANLPDDTKIETIVNVIGDFGVLENVQSNVEFRYDESDKRITLVPTVMNQVKNNINDEWNKEFTKEGYKAEYFSNNDGDMILNYTKQVRILPCYDMCIEASVPDTCSNTCDVVIDFIHVSGYRFDTCEEMFEVTTARELMRCIANFVNDCFHDFETIHG